jgi:hypothetical protein
MRKGAAERTCRSAGLLGDLKQRGLLELFPASGPVSASTLAFVMAGYLDATKRAVAVQPVPGERPKRKTATV